MERVSVVVTPMYHEFSCVRTHYHYLLAFPEREDSFIFEENYGLARHLQSEVCMFFRA